MIPEQHFFPGMSEQQLCPDGAPPRLSVLGDQRTRHVLSVLQDRSRPIPIRDLTVRIATRENGGEPSDVDEKELRRIRIDLRHRCLPELESAGLLERRSNGVVVDEPLTTRLDDITLPGLEEHDQRFWDAVDALLARPYRLCLGIIAASRRRAVRGSELTTELARCDPDSWPDRGEEKSLLGVLYHVDLPRLADEGLIEYDPDEMEVTHTPKLITVLERLGLDSELKEPIGSE